MKRLSIKALALMLVFSLSAVGLSACGELNSDESAIKLTKKGEILTCSVEELDKDFYDEEELKDYVNETVEEYLAENEDASVKVQKLSVSDGIAKLNMKYDSADTYASFNNVTFYVGTVAKALAAGYEFEGSFASITDGASSDAAASAWSEYAASLSEDEESADASGDASGDISDVSAGDLSGTSILATSLEYNVLVVSENALVTVPGDIIYVSAGNTKMTASDTVRISGSDGLTYIIYQ